MTTLNELAKEYEAYVKTDNAFQRKARIMQSIWRTEKGYAAGSHRGKTLGSRLPVLWAMDTLANYLTLTIAKVVRHEIDNIHQTGKLIAQPRIFNDLLSSQPLAFNLFAELQQDLRLATTVFRELAPNRVQTVTRIAFEYSPGRRDSRYTADKSAFDVYVEYQTPKDKRGFIGIEVKYHENLGGKASTHKARYDEIAETMDCFKADCLPRFRKQPLQQIWRDHLLAGSILQVDNFDDGFFVFLYPQDNTRCANAVKDYLACLTHRHTFEAWTLEHVSAVIQRHTDADWIAAFIDRYLNFAKLELD